MVEVFKTDVTEFCDAEKLLQKIKEHFCHYRINFDLEDCDKILRVEYDGNILDYKSLESIFSASGFHLEILDS